MIPRLPNRGVVLHHCAERGLKLNVFSSLNLDESKYRRSSDPHRLSAFEYTNVEDGESITVVNGEVTRFDYTADSGSNHLKCSSKIDRPGSSSSYKLDEYGELQRKDENSRLDNFAITLMQTPGSKVTYTVIQVEQLPGQKREHAHAERCVI